ncbi:T9SS type A sorting domain-containing protein [Psychroserpens sp. Hel_I_66]|uniref:T9SS type A sorting domain-containing protein n=1 Tax=Psychroserpens sp. Hel_I_66 TaxID=1250004 RepID=UPI000648A9E7|nr:T9SS type A sorting domain-containing protein [Psychroserpens sp. Hel_I_66]
MKTSLFLKAITILFFQFYFYDTSAQITTDQLLENTYKLYDYQRQYNGVYRDSKIINGTDYHPSSAANTGVGLISLCIAEEAGYINFGRDLAAQTLRTMLGYTAGFNPDRNSKGFYRHFLEIDNGQQAWNSEYSTIDTALLAAGALFAKKYFNDAEISALADELFLSVEWSAAISNPSTGAIWRELQPNGAGQGTSALPFNEYIIVAYFAMKSEGNSGGVGTSAWNVWQQLNNFANANYWGYDLLADSNNVNAFQSDFTVQFPYYLMFWAHNSTLYKTYMSNMASADKFYYGQIAGMYPNLNAYEWGLGAGNSPATFNGNFYTPYGYNADHINNHPARIVSPHIVAGYIPIQASARNDLQQMMNGTKGIYTLGTGEKLLWRYSLDEVNWNSDQIQGIDYSTMLYGLAANKFGTNFFTTNNNYDFPTPNFSSTNSCVTGVQAYYGPVLGTTGSYNGSSSTRDKPFDSNNNTFFDGPNGNNQWVGMDLLSNQNITCIRFRPRNNFGYRMRGGKFQISNNANFSNPTTIYTIPSNANLNFQNYFISTGSTNGVSARYIRYLSPNNGWGNIAEMRVYRSSETNRNSNIKLEDQPKVVNHIDNLTLSPNPASKEIQLDFYLENESDIEYRIYNTMGREIQSLSKNHIETGEINQKLNIENLAEGIYFIHLKTKNKVLIKRFIVAKE